MSNEDEQGKRKSTNPDKEFVDFCIKERKILSKPKGLPKSNRSPAKYPQGAGRIRKAAKPPTAALRVRFEKEEQQNERTVTFAKSRRKRYNAYGDVELVM